MPPALADSLKTRAVTLGTTMLKNQSQWYQNGQFHNPYGEQWVYMSSGPAALAASMYRAQGDGKYLSTCTESFDLAIDQFSTPGYFVDSPAASVPATGLEIYVFTSNLAWAMYVLGANLDATRRAKYLAALKTNIEYLATGGNMPYYANGNWIASQVRTMHLIRELCKQNGDYAGYHRMSSLYELCYTCMMTPGAIPVAGYPLGNTALWAGYGWVTDTAGGWADWSDTVGHLTETNGGPPMPNAGAGTSSDGIAPFGTYDGDYAGLALEHLTQWFVAAREVRALKVVNAYFNRYMATINTTTWIGDFTHGSRHNNPGNGIYVPTLAVLQLLGQRQSTIALRAGDVNPFTDAKVLSQWDNMIIGVMTPPVNGAVPLGIARSWATVVGTVLLACEISQQRL